MATRAIRAHLNICDYDDCQHEWISREVPDRCAKCKRRRWNKGGLVVKSRTTFIVPPISKGANKHGSLSR